MPPNFPPTQNIPPFERKPVALKPPPPLADVQTKNIVMFATIFSVLAVIVGLYFIFRPEHKVSSSASTQAQTGTSTVNTDNAPTQNSLFSLFKNFCTFL